jgi:hypothetical protein
MSTQRIVLFVFLLTGLLLFAGAAAEAAAFESTQGWLKSVDETAGVIQLAMSLSNPSQTVSLSATKWVIGQCQRRLDTRKGFNIWMDVTVCPGSGKGCYYSYGLRPKG